MKRYKYETWSVLPVDIAWKGILEFITTGKASSEIQWITPNEIPEDGNW